MSLWPGHFGLGNEVRSGFCHCDLLYLDFSYWVHCLDIFFSPCMFFPFQGLSEAACIDNFWIIQVWLHTLWKMMDFKLDTFGTNFSNTQMAWTEKKVNLITYWRGKYVQYHSDIYVACWGTPNMSFTMPRLCTVQKYSFSCETQVTLYQLVWHLYRDIYEKFNQ